MGKNIKEMKKRIEEQGYTYFRVEAFIEGDSDESDWACWAASSNFDEMLEEYKEVLDVTEKECKRYSYKKIGTVYLIAFLSDNSEENYGDCIETLIYQEVKNMY